MEEESPVEDLKVMKYKRVLPHAVGNYVTLIFNENEAQVYYVLFLVWDNHHCCGDV